MQEVHEGEADQLPRDPEPGRQDEPAASRQRGLGRGDLARRRGRARHLPELPHQPLRGERQLLHEPRYAVNTAAATERVAAISNSYGGVGSDCGTKAAYNHPNIAITVSAGDSGFGVACPAAQNTVVAVGGTTLHLNGSGGYLSESVVERHRLRLLEEHPRAVVADAATNWAAIGCGTKRGITTCPPTPTRPREPPSTTRYGFGGWLQVGGTSLSSPLIAGVYALAGNAARGPTRPRASTTVPGSLHDVTTGSNGSCGAPHRCNAARASATTCRPASARRTGWAASKHPVRTRRRNTGRGPSGPLPPCEAWALLLERQLRGSGPIHPSDLWH